MLEDKILTVLANAAVPIKSRQIETANNVSGAEVREAVRVLRRKGYPICSGSCGYWIGDKEEIEHTIAQLKSRGTDMLETARAMENMQINGQLEALI